MANQNSIFYKIGAAVKTKIDGLLNPYTSPVDLQDSITLGTVAEFNYVNGASNLRIIGLDTSATYNTIQITANQASGFPVSVNNNNGAVTIDTANDETVAGLATYISNTPGLNYNAVFITGDGSELVSASPVSSAQNFTAGKTVTTRSGLTVSGDLTVSGTTTTVDTATLTIEDNIINLSKGASAGAYTSDSGFYFERGSGAEAAFFVFDESVDKFVLGETSGAATDPSLTATATDAGRGTLQVGKVEVYDDVTTTFLEIGSLDDFEAGLA